MERLAQLTSLVVTLGALSAACGGEGPETETRQTPCDGGITTEPSVVAVVPGGPPSSKNALFARGTTAYVVSSQTSADMTVTAIDLCSHTTSVLASFDNVQDAAIAGDAMLLSVWRAGGPELVRLPLDGGDVETVAVLAPGSQLESAGAGVVVGMGKADGSSVDGELELFELSGSELVPFGLVSGVPQTGTGGTSTDLVGASEAGPYLIQWFDCGCTPKLQLHSFDGSTTLDLKYTGVQIPFCTEFSRGCRMT